MRKPRTGEHICNCKAYKFPHRFGGGKCHGFHIVYDTWHTYFGGGTCSNCLCLDTSTYPFTCEIVEGRDKTTHCEALQEYLVENDIKLLGEYWQD